MASLKQKVKARQRAAATPYESQIAAEATLRFNPERSTLLAQQEGLRGQLDSDLAAARGTARGIKAAAEQAQPKIQKAYADAGRILANVDREVEADVAGLGPGADRIKASIARDAAGTTRRLGESMSTATTELAQRAFDAEAGRAHAEGNARARFASESSKLGERLRNLGVEEGAFTQGRAGELAREDADRDFRAAESRRSRQSQRSLQEDQQSFQREEKAKDRAARRRGSLPGGVKPASLDAHRSFQSDLAKVRAVAQRQKRLGKDRAQTAQLLVNGRDAVKVEPVIDEEKYKRERAAGATESEAKRRATREPGGELPAVDAVDEKLASIALDVAYDGHVSRENAKWLHKSGYSLKQLGLPTYSSTGGAQGARRRRQARDQQLQRKVAEAGRLLGGR